VEPSRVEIEMAIKLLKNNKVAGGDRICGELLKLEGPKLTYEIWDKEEIPTELKLLIICPILKKGDLKCVENYTGMRYTCIA